MSEPTPSPVDSLLRRLTSRMRFPQLFAFTATLFLVDLVIPDFIPFVDELLLGLATLLLGLWRDDRIGQAEETGGPKPPMKDVTPGDR